MSTGNCWFSWPAAVLRAALKIPGVVDLDVRAALDALARTYRTLQNGIYYDSRPENPLAGEVCGIVRTPWMSFAGWRGSAWELPGRATATC